MVRMCIVENCDSNDMKILCHRFPSKKILAEMWLESLHLQGYSFEELNKYVVCTLHFDPKDYRNAESNYLNSTAVPRLINVESRMPLFSENVEEIAHQYEDDAEADANEPRVKNQFLDEILQEDLPLKSSISYSPYEYDILEDDDACIESEENEYEEEPESKEVKFVYLTNSEHSESFDETTKDFSDAACQVPEEGEEELDEFSNLSRKELVERLRNSQMEISRLERKLKNFEKIQSKILQNIDMLKCVVETA
uniref:THAP-type domain-containing protein n=1 Tax=Tabanus bromius TaxID=304241 RepID=A0A0K8TQK9_TABBR